LSADTGESRSELAHAAEWLGTLPMNGRRKRDFENVADLWCGPDDELLDAREAAVLLTVKPSTLLSWARERRVPVVRLGPRHLRWTRPLLREIRDSALDPGRRI